MKKLIIAMTAAGTLLGMASAQAEDGRVHFVGKVREATCQLVSDADQTVKLPEVATTALPTDGANGGQAPFDISLAKCGANQGLAIRFESDGEQVDVDRNLLRNALETASNGAKNVEIELLNQNHNPIKLDAGPTQVPSQVAYASADGTYTQNYVARYRAIGQVQPGEVAAHVRYTVEYH